MALQVMVGDGGCHLIGPAHQADDQIQRVDGLVDQGAAAFGGPPALPAPGRVVVFAAAPSDKGADAKQQAVDTLPQDLLAGLSRDVGMV